MLKVINHPSPCNQANYFGLCSALRLMWFTQKCVEPRKMRDMPVILYTVCMQMEVEILSEKGND